MARDLTDLRLSGTRWLKTGQPAETVARSRRSFRIRPRSLEDRRARCQAPVQLRNMGTEFGFALKHALAQTQDAGAPAI